MINQEKSELHVSILTAENQQIMMEVSGTNVLGEDIRLKGKYVPCPLEIPSH